MKQLTLATAGFDRYAKTTRRAVFLAEDGSGCARIRARGPEKKDIEYAQAIS